MIGQKFVLDTSTDIRDLTGVFMTITASVDTLCRNVRMLPVTATHAKLLTEIENVLVMLNSMVRHCLSSGCNINANTATIPLALNRSHAALVPVKCYIDLVNGQSGLTSDTGRSPLVTGRNTTSSALSCRPLATVISVNHIDSVGDQSNQSIPSCQLVSESSQNGTTSRIPVDTPRSAVSTPLPAVTIRATNNVTSSDIHPLEATRIKNRKGAIKRCKQVQSTPEDDNPPPKKAKPFHFGFVNW